MQFFYDFKDGIVGSVFLINLLGFCGNFRDCLKEFLILKKSLKFKFSKKSLKL
jgi:hypothetical protein